MSKPTPKSNTETTTDEKKGNLFADTNVSIKTGHLTKDAELLKEGKFVKIRIASNKTYLDGNDETQTITDYFNILVRSNSEEAYKVSTGLKKGDWAYFKGEDRTKTVYGENGFKHTVSAIFANKVFLKKAKAASPSNSAEIPFDQVEATPEAAIN